jgi:hypothetical protein
MGKYCHSSDRNSHLEKISLLLNNKIAKAIPNKTEAIRLFLDRSISLLAVLAFRDRLARDRKSTIEIATNRLDNPSG